MLDERTKNYFAAIRKNIGFIGTNYGWDGIEELLKKKGLLETAELKKVKAYDGYANSTEISIYSYIINGQQRYCAELSYQTDIDDYCVETHIFSKMPSQEDVFTIRDIDSLEFKLKRGELQPEFNCWECGRHVHWLDRDGEFSIKKNGLEEQYCGC